ncbi:Crp/Fnr family transcriptional regulator [Bradyrhizobium sp. 186]|uniref:Crp/Fnr family transcriptional regulator n=1 Tax=Bradyrhizobium sp. 186 TaxID=2782654 RepID=UPI0020013953|nr:Crp/Fnr family transcriptional regulator [Bradyrhizobium sp. 186]
MLQQSSGRSIVRNAILASLPLPDLAAVGEYLEPIVLKERMIIQEQRKRVDHVYFIESGLISHRIGSGGSLLEAAIVGYRGVIGAAFLLGGYPPVHQSVVLFPGRALRIRVDELRRLMDERVQVREAIGRYLQAFAVHSTQTGFCGVRHSCEPRVATWLCLTCDAIGNSVLPVTHDYLSTVLGLRRASVTGALIRFEERRLIRKTRGVLHVDDRKAIEPECCSCYAVVAAAYTSSEETSSFYVDNSLKQPRFGSTARSQNTNSA